MAPLRGALEDLGYAPGENQQTVRGYKGQTVDAELAVAVDGGADFGFRWNESNHAYEFVTDLDLWRQPVPVERFLSRLTQRYALRSVLEATRQEGFDVTEQRDCQDGSIELVVTRWDA